MPKLLDRAASTLGGLSPRTVGLLSAAGFTAAGIAAVMAENLRTATDSDRSLTERARAVGTTSLGAVLSGPSGLSQRGRSLLHRGDGDGRGRAAPETEPETAPEATTETEPVPPAGQAAQVATSPSAAPEAAGASAAAVRDLPREPAAPPTPPVTGAVDPAQQEPVPPRGIDTSSPAAELDVEATVAEEPAEGPGEESPAGRRARTGADTIETGLTADLERMTVAQLRARAAEDGIPGRSKMNKTELISALADRES